MSKRHRQARQGEKAAGVRLLDPARDVPDLLEHLRLVVEARKELDDIQDHTVHCLMACGVTFAEIGTALGVSRQSVHSRYAGSITPVATSPDGPAIWSSLSPGKVESGDPVNDR